MTSVTIVFDTEDVSDEAARNWVDALVQDGLISGSVVDRVLVNNVVYCDREGIVAHRERFGSVRWSR